MIDRTVFPPQRYQFAITALIWTIAGCLLVLLDGFVSVGNLALILVLAATISSLWLSWWSSMLASGAAILLFNYHFVDPRGTFAVNLETDVLLLTTMLGVSWIVTFVMTRLRLLLARERKHLERLGQLREFGDALRDAQTIEQCALALQTALERVASAPVSLLLLSSRIGAEQSSDAAQGGHLMLGFADSAQQEGLQHCTSTTQPLGRGTGRFEREQAMYLPIRGRSNAFGAVMVQLPAETLVDPLRHHLQTMCDQMGADLERASAMQLASASRDAAQVQSLRNTLLAAIAHDHRTPLACILSAASSLQEQDRLLSPDQRRQLADTIAGEATQLARITDNTLQLARLDAPGLVLRKDWESLEEIVGAVMNRIRARGLEGRITAQIAIAMPLLKCDAVLITQLLENLIDNALKYAGNSMIEIEAVNDGVTGTLAVCDRGPGISSATWQHVFGVFSGCSGGVQSPPARDASPGPALGSRGGGIGLALCQAIARAHDGTFQYRDRDGGGAMFEYVWTLDTPPQGDPL